MLSLCTRNLLPRMFESTCVSLLLLSYQRYLNRLWLGSCHFLEGNSLFPPFHCLYRRGLGTCDVLHTWSHHLQVALGRVMEGRLFQSNFSVAFDRGSHSCPLRKLRYIGVKGQYVSIKSEFLSDRRQCSAFRW